MWFRLLLRTRQIFFCFFKLQIRGFLSMRQMPAFFAGTRICWKNTIIKTTYLIKLNYKENIGERLQKLSLANNSITIHDQTIC